MHLILRASAERTCELETVELDDRPVDCESQATHGHADKNCKPTHDDSWLTLSHWPSDLNDEGVCCVPNF